MYLSAWCKAVLGAYPKMSDKYHIRGPHLGPCGLALLINIFNITRIKDDGTEEKDQRVGSQEDKKKMADLFEYLNFEVDVKVDLTRKEIGKHSD